MLSETDKEIIALAIIGKGQLESFSDYDGARYFYLFEIHEVTNVKKWVFFDFEQGVSNPRVYEYCCSYQSMDEFFDALCDEDHHGIRIPDMSIPPDGWCPDVQ